MFMLKWLSRLPMWMLYALSDIMYVLVYYVLGYRKKVVYSNLRNSFPEKSNAEIKAIAKSFYKGFMDFNMETLKAFTISEKELLKRVQFTNVPEVEPQARANQSILVMASHQFNWEWALLAGCLVLPFPVDAVYQRLKNTGFNDIMLKTRGKFGGQPIDKNQILRAILKTKHRLRALGIVADQSPRRNSPKYWTEFMNQETAFYIGSEQIAQAANFPVYFFRVTKPKRGHYEVELVKLADPPYDKQSHNILEAYIKETERLIRDQPEGYLWSHKRWKLKRDQEK
ncbi:lysophospholipid acyltransferase family protein [Fulvivirga ligni]|uniref:lysophospholipid acyltransferase family protein n=1 Tax=Fulvivirga ligni TaxID=2904246 RepID=UPI001F332F34|nr:lysophospholipid acyltransferase family protein [Fulvivirga ligni]UII22742.1 lysophospholipid acyltransferase family protein [Fulvivirga ligni]